MQTCSKACDTKHLPPGMRGLSSTRARSASVALVGDQVSNHFKHARNPNRPAGSQRPRSTSNEPVLGLRLAHRGSATPELIVAGLLFRLALKEKRGQVRVFRLARGSSSWIGAP